MAMVRATGPGQWLGLGPGLGLAMAMSITMLMMSPWLWLDDSAFVAPQLVLVRSRAEFVTYSVCLIWTEQSLVSVLHLEQNGWLWSANFCFFSVIPSWPYRATDLDHTRTCTTSQCTHTHMHTHMHVYTHVHTQHTRVHAHTQSMDRDNMIS